MRGSLGTVPLSVFDPLTATIIHIVAGVPRVGDQHARRRVLDEAFGEWGRVSKLWFLADEGSAFIKFRWRSTAQLVLEACDGRPLRPQDSEPLQLAWCTTDPSLVVNQQGRELAYNAMREARERSRDVAALYERLERECKSSGSSRSTSSSTSVTLTGKRGRGEEAAPAEALAAWHEGETERLSAVTTTYPGGLPENGAPTASALTDDGGGGAEDASSSLPAGWASSIDPQYGVAYFWHAATGRTQWERPSD